jgi:hypothetical protein
MLMLMLMLMMLMLMLDASNLALGDIERPPAP